MESLTENTTFLKPNEMCNFLHFTIILTGFFMLLQVINVLYYKCWQFDRFKTISDAITVPKAMRFQVIFQLFRNIILLQLFFFF